MINMQHRAAQLALQASWFKLDDSWYEILGVDEDEQVIQCIAHNSGEQYDVPFAEADSAEFFVLQQLQMST